MKALTLLAWLASATLIFGQAAEEASDKSPKAGKDAPESKEEKPKDTKEQKPKVTKGGVKIAGQDISYIAKTGTLPLLKDDGTIRANVFYVYYAAAGPDGAPLAATD